MIIIAAPGGPIKSRLVTPIPMAFSWATLAIYLLFEAILFTTIETHSLTYVAYAPEAILYFFIVALDSVRFQGHRQGTTGFYRDCLAFSTIDYFGILARRPRPYHFARRILIRNWSIKVEYG